MLSEKIWKLFQRNLEDTKGVSRRCKYKKNTGYVKAKRRGQTDLQWQTKHYKENKRLSSTNPTDSSWFFPHSWHITGFVTILTRRVTLVVQELLTLPEHPSSTPVVSGVRVTRSLVLCVYFVDRCLSFLPFLLSVLQFTDPDYPFWFKLFFELQCSERLNSAFFTIETRRIIWYWTPVYVIDYK